MTQHSWYRNTSSKVETNLKRYIKPTVTLAARAGKKLQNI
jgi:hypothetical protein